MCHYFLEDVHCEYENKWRNRASLPNPSLQTKILEVTTINYDRERRGANTIHKEVSAISIETHFLQNLFNKKPVDSIECR